MISKKGKYCKALIVKSFSMPNQGGSVGASSSKINRSLFLHKTQGPELKQFKIDEFQHRKGDAF